MKVAGDVDIDLQSNWEPSSVFPWARGSLVKDGNLSPHPCGYYPQRIPIDLITGLSAIPYDIAENIGYQKLDFLHLHILSHFQSREEIEELVKIEPNWDLLLDPVHQKKLFQLANHADILNAVKPRSIEELADVLALIRPGKKNLLKLYLSHREVTRRTLYAKDESGYSFKRAHAIPYAMNIVLQLHILEDGIL